MDVNFDYFGQPELPYIILTNPDKTELFSLSLAYETKLTKRFNTLSEFSFIYPKSIDGGVTELEAFDYLQNKRLVLIEGYGYFQITNAELNSDGSVPIMTVECKSLEYELIQKPVVAYGKTVPLYNILSPEGTLLYDMVQLAPTWSVGTISAELLVKFRTFNVSNSNIYNFLTNDVANAFEAIFIFDTVTKTINVKTIDDATLESDIFLSYDNVISSSTFSEKSDEITTVLSVYGGGNLNIRSVNPLGTDKIYNFDYYKTIAWMPQSLIDAITAWEALVDSSQAQYATNLTYLSTYNAELLVLQATLATLNSEYLSLEGVQKARIQQDLPYADITVLMEAKQVEIDNQETLITNKQTQISGINTLLQTTHDEVSFENNFTESQYLALTDFFYGNTYKNENIIQTDSMTEVEVQAAAQSLYDQAQNVLGRVSQPRYELGLESVNYTVLEDFSVFTNQTEVGTIVTCELKDNTYSEVVLLEMQFQFDDPSAFSMTFSNRLRLDNGNFTYSDLMGEVVKTGSAVAFDSMKWSNWENNYKNDVTSFISSSLDATTNNLISNSNQEILINQNGLRARNYDGSTYSLKQAWLVNNVLAFSDDGFQTSKLALGEITLPAGGTAYGLVGDVIIGRILAGNTLTIANDANNFVLDETGATLNNAKFSIQNTNTKIVIDPTALNAFVIQKNEGGTFNNKFWVDNTGNVNFSGTLSGATGTFSGTLSATVGNIGTLVIDANGLKTADGLNYLRGNGDLKWGGLSIIGGTATFNGNIFADKLVGAVSYTQLTDIPANKITSGTMSGYRVSGGSIYGTQFDWGAAHLYSVGSNAELLANGTVSIGSSAGAAVSAGSNVTITGNAMNVYANANFLNGIKANGSSGVTIGYSVTTPYGTRVLTFRYGILIGYT